MSLATCTMPAMAAIGAASAPLRPAQDPPRLRVVDRRLCAIAAQADAWESHPEALELEMTPLKVTIENRSDKPLRVSYEAFAIETGRGIRLELAIPEGVIEPGGTVSGFLFVPQDRRRSRTRDVQGRSHGRPRARDHGDGGGGSIQGPHGFGIEAPHRRGRAIMSRLP